MVTTGLLVRLLVQHGKDDEVEAFLRSALPLAQQEPETTAWFAIRFGRSEYGVFDVFPGDAGRDAHLSGPIAQALMAHADALLAEPPSIEKITILADKLPMTTPSTPDTKGLLLSFRAHTGKEAEVAQFLRDAQPMALDEEKTTAWFAIQHANGDFAIFDVFPDNGGRLAHLSGHIARELAKHGLSLLGSIPDLELLDVLAEKLPG